MTAVMPMVRNHSVSTLIVHAVWATAGRASVLALSSDPWLARELGRQSSDLGAVLLAVGNAADHVHVVVQHSPRVAVAELIGRLKGASSHAAHVLGIIGREQGWQVGYWAESVAAADIGPLVHYVTHQREHHATEGTPEAWQHAAG